MAPRRPGTQPTEADPTSDIGAKRARVVGEDENSTQVRLRARTRACKPACTVTAHILVWLLAAALAVCAQRLRKFASTKGCECSKDTLGCRSTHLQYISFGCSLPIKSQEESPASTRPLC